MVSRVLDAGTMHCEIKSRGCMYQSRNGTPIHTEYFRVELSGVLIVGGASC